MRHVARTESIWPITCHALKILIDGFLALIFCDPSIFTHRMRLLPFACGNFAVATWQESNQVRKGG